MTSTKTEAKKERAADPTAAAKKAAARVRAAADKLTEALTSASAAGLSVAVKIGNPMDSQEFADARYVTVDSITGKVTL